MLENIYILKWITSLRSLSSFRWEWSQIDASIHIMKEDMNHTLSKAMTPGSFLPLRNSHTTEASLIIVKLKVEFDSFTIASHALFPTTVMLQLLWLSRLSIWASSEAPFVQLLVRNFTGPIQVTFCNSNQGGLTISPHKASNNVYLKTQKRTDYDQERKYIWHQGGI